MDDLSSREVKDFTLVGAMGPAGGGRNDLSPRFKRHFNVISTCPFTDETSMTIFSTIMDGYFKANQFGDDIKGVEL